MPEAKSEGPDDEVGLFANAEAALWLSESLIFALLEAQVLDTDAMLEAIEIVIAAKKAEAREGGNPGSARSAAARLAAISSSIGAARAARKAQRTRGRRPRPARPD